MLELFYICFGKTNMGFPDGLTGKESSRNAGDVGDSCSIPGSVRFPGGGNSSPLQYSRLEKPLDRGAWRVTVQGAAESDMTEHIVLGGADGRRRTKWCSVKRIRRTCGCKGRTPSCYS